ncbi:hypothetical protein FQN57_000081 [Myotisia sp. PD_48]|nr:hypothetical protein FQN57_000081 [Myotisia sp. PD_48]
MYYILDDDVDYHNESEPWTTSCSLLPGQSVNILNVPIHLPAVSTLHHRNGSASSLATPKQTMNPEDKYLNPRTPPRPKLPRITTSPSTLSDRPDRLSPLPSPSHLVHIHGRSASDPREMTRKKTRIPVKLSLNNLKPSGTNLRNALFNLGSSRSDKSDQLEKNGQLQSWESPLHASRSSPSLNLLDHQYVRPRPSHLNLSASSASPSRCGSPAELVIGTGPLIARNESDNCVSRNSNRTPLGHPASTNDYRTHDNTDQDAHPLDIPPSNDPAAPVSRRVRLGDSDRSRSTSIPGLRTKRLPTLPNSPSSVLDEHFGPMWNMPSPELDLDIVRSRFSESTAGSPDSASKRFSYPEESRFSLWSTDTELITPCSMTSASTFNESNVSPDSALPMSFSALPRGPETANSKDNPEYYLGAGCYEDNSSTPNPSRWRPSLSWDNPDPFNSIGLNDQMDDDPGYTPRVSPRRQRFPSHEDEQSTRKINAIMKELIDEMSYLGRMVEAEETDLGPIPV